MNITVEQLLDMMHQCPEGYFHRVGSSARPMPTDFVVRLYQERNLTRIKRFEELPMPGTSFATLNESLWRRFVSSRAESAETALQKRNLLASNTEGQIQASVVGILMCSDETELLLIIYSAKLANQEEEVDPA